MREAVINIFPAYSNHARRQPPRVFDLSIADAADVYLDFAKSPIGFDSNLA